MATRRLVSIVVPVHDEAPGLRAFHTELRRAVDGLDEDVEIIYVNDGSTDASLDVIRALRAEDGRVRGIDLSRNYGHQAAISAGTQAARGDAVIHIDADLEYPPSLIPDMVARWRGGAQIVETQRRGGARLTPKALLSRAFYRLFNAISATQIVPGGSDFRLLDRACVEVINSLPERNRFLRGITQWIGFARDVLPFTPGTRLHGQPSYTFRKSLVLALHGILHFSSLPLAAAFAVGALVVAGALAWVGWQLLAHGAVSEHVSTLVVVLLVGGMNLLFTGVLSLYVWMLIEQSRQRPIYVVRERLGFDEPRARPLRRAEG